MDKIQSKSVKLFYRGFFSEGLKEDKHIDHPSLGLRKTIQKAPGQQKKKLEKMGKLQKHSFPTRIFHRYE